MAKLLKFELHNILRQKIIYAVIVVMMVYLTLQNQTSPARLEYLQSIGYGFEDMVIGTLTSCYFSSFMAIIISLVVCRDYEQKVIKNIYAKGYTHLQVYSAKFIFVLLITAVVCIFTLGVGILEAGLAFGFQRTDIWFFLFAQLLAMLAYSAFGYMICQLMKKSGLAIAFLILVPPLGGMLLDVIDMSLPFSFSFGDLWITQTMSYIHGGTITGKEVMLSFITSLVYIVGSFFIGLQKKNNKY